MGDRSGGVGGIDGEPGSTISAMRLVVGGSGQEEAKACESEGLQGGPNSCERAPADLVRGG